MGWLNSRKWWAMALVLMVGLPLIVGCSSDDKDPPPTQPDPTPVTGTITGSVQLQAGMSGDLRNSRVAIYASFDDWNNDRVLRHTTAQGTEFQVSFTFTNLAPGAYFVDVWKDQNNNGRIDQGDFFGVHGSTQWPNPTISPLAVVAGQTSTTTIYAILIQ